MRRCFSLLLLLLISCSIICFANAENNSLIIEQVANGAFSNNVSCEGKTVIDLGSTDNSGICSLIFDFSDGNKSINISDGMGHVRIHFFYTDQELVEALYHMIPYFSEIEDSLPKGVAFRIEIRLRHGTDDDAVIKITSADIVNF